MIQYFQLTPEILLEYVYNGDPKLNEDGVKGNEKDICIKEHETILLKSDAFLSKYLCFKNDNEGLDGISNLVLPLNNTETQFVVVRNNESKEQNFYKTINVSNRYLTRNGSGYIYEDTNYDKDIISEGKSCDVKYDKCIIHFTSRNYFGSYDSLIFQAYAYMSNKAKLYFASFLFKKTANVELKSEHLLYNEKLYTTQVEFDIPSVYSILSKKLNDSSDSDSDYGNVLFNNALLNQGVKLLENTPIGINVYGVSGSTIGIDNYIRLNTLKINSIHIPYIYNRLDEICINLREVEDGDYFEIDPQIGSGYRSFVDYIESIGDDIRSYMVMHELSLKEMWVDNNITYSETTHKEFHIIDINEDDEDDEISKKFDAKIKYRPICIKSGTGYKATIIDKIKIINTIDNSSYEVIGSIDILNPYKYGIKLKRLDIDRPIINVYNKSNSAIGGGLGSGLEGNGSGSGSGSNGLDYGSPLGSVSGSFKGVLSGEFGGNGSGGNGSGGNGSNGSTTFGSISGNVSGNIPGFGKINGAINSKITNSKLENGNLNIEGPLNISLSGSAYGGGVNGDGSNSNGIIILNKNGGFVVENNSQNITSFIECTNVGVSISELSPEDIS